MPDVPGSASIGPGQLFGCHALGRIVPGQSTMGMGVPDLQCTRVERGVEALSGGRELLAGGLLFRVKSEEAEIVVVRMSRQLHDQTEEERNKKVAPELLSDTPPMRRAASDTGSFAARLTTLTTSSMSTWPGELRYRPTHLPYMFVTCHLRTVVPFSCAMSGSDASCPGIRRLCEW
eukprot:1967211-Rhodomonas_salina.1